MIVKYVNYGNSKYGIPMYIITMEFNSNDGYLVEVAPCDTNGKKVSDAVAWNTFSTRWSAYKYMRQQYKEFYNHVNHHI